MRSQLFDGASRADVDIHQAGRGAAGVLIGGFVSLVLWIGIAGIAQVFF